eukprot:9473730-Pyramimonas_sp.AAC.1
MSCRESAAPGHSPVRLLYQRTHRKLRQSILGGESLAPSRPRERLHPIGNGSPYIPRARTLFLMRREW